MIESRKPLVSVLMTSYNREKFIQEAIESVLISTYTNLELIIVDDCSKDRTVEIAKEFEVKDNRVRVYVNPHNLGDYPNRNRAAGYAKGDFLMYVDSDDSIKADAIEYIINEFGAHPEADFSLVYYFKDISSPLVLNPKDSIEKNFYDKGFLNIGPGGTIIKRNYFNKIGGFPEKYGPANDMYYNIKAASNSKLLLLPYQYINYRIHDGQEANNKYSYLYNNYRYFADALILPELPLTVNQKKTLLRNRARGVARGLIQFLIKTRDLRKTIEAYKLSGIQIHKLI